jgi:hypothetical protein
LPDGHEFEVDQYGGWYDEVGNYYNSIGEPCAPPGTPRSLKLINLDEYYGRGGYGEDDDSLLGDYDITGGDDGQINYDDMVEHVEVASKLTLSKNYSCPT